MNRSGVFSAASTVGTSKATHRSSRRVGVFFQFVGSGEEVDWTGKYSAGGLEAID